MRDRAPFDELDLLATGAIVPVGWIEGSSNHAMRVDVTRTGGDERAIALPAVYKPTAGERPLRDFPLGTLTRREVAAYHVSEATGWRIVPPTVLRDGPHGEGMVQRWVVIDPGVDVVGMVMADDPRLRKMAVFDAVVNNTDRKGSHLLPAPGGHIFGVDHGVCFAAEPKLRTVLWGWRGRPLTDGELAGVAAVRRAIDAALGEVLAGLLAADEVLATQERADRLLRDRMFPLPRHDWPAIPFPPF